MRTISVFIPLGLLLLVSCRGEPSQNPPIHPNLNMDFQKKYKPQQQNTFFADHRAMRPLVAGVVAKETYIPREDMFSKDGKDAQGQYAKVVPRLITKEFLLRGQQRFNIYCAPCHDETGSGKGIIISRGMLLPPSFHSQRLVDMPPGQVYEAIVKGVRGNMPAYNTVIPVEDRWAIVSYFKYALQPSHRARLSDVPEDVAVSKGWKK